jgi:hypothetical protein
MFKTVEEKLKDALHGDLLENALDFVTYLRNAGMTTKEDDTRFYYKEELMCIIICWKDAWLLCDAPTDDCEGYRVGEDVRAFARSRVKVCGIADGSHACGCGSEPGKDFTVFGTGYKNVCTSELQFHNPSAEDLVQVKKLMDLWLYKVDNLGGYSSQDR